jgi:hypothetical protein
VVVVACIYLVLFISLELKNVLVHLTSHLVVSLQVTNSRLFLVYRLLVTRRTTLPSIVVREI